MGNNEPGSPNAGAHPGEKVPDPAVAARVTRESMEPELSESDRPLIETSHRIPVTGEMFVPWDGNGLVLECAAGAVLRWRRAASHRTAVRADRPLT
ncbi:MAG: hypothetical protein OXF94_13515 [Gammaproteobacteria bacterium]|nr:hypothetical protein [Gammaproteobacteria bacterium]